MNDLIESNRIVFDRLVVENEEDIKYNGTYAEREMDDPIWTEYDGLWY